MDCQFQSVLYWVGRVGEAGGCGDWGGGCWGRESHCQGVCGVWGEDWRVRDLILLSMHTYLYILSFINIIPSMISLPCSHPSLASNLALQIINTLNNTKILPGPVLPDNKQAPCINIGGINIHNKMFQILQLLLVAVMVREQFFHEIGLFCRQGLVVGVTAQDVLEQRFYLVYVGVRLATELELLEFFGTTRAAAFLLHFLLLVVLFTQIIDNAIIMMPMLLPESVKFFPLSFLDFDNSLANFQALALQLGDEFGCA